MVVQPKVKGFMCTTAHPEGCKESVRRQIEYVKSQPKADSESRHRDRSYLPPRETPAF